MDGLLVFTSVLEHANPAGMKLCCIWQITRTVGASVLKEIWWSAGSNENHARKLRFIANKMGCIPAFLILFDGKTQLRQFVITARILNSQRAVNSLSRRPPA